MADGKSPPGGDEPERFELGAFAGLPPGLGLSRLPVGRHGLPRSLVADNQRLRIIAAMLDLLPQHGYPGTTIGHVTSEAGVSRGAFYEQFSSKEECFLATYDLAGEWLCGRIERAVEADKEWPTRVRDGVSVTLRLLAANPTLAHLFGVEAPQAGPAARERRQACLSRLAETLRADRPDRPDLPPDLEELLLGGILSLVDRYADTGRAEQLPDAIDEMVRYLLLPYLGPGETRRVVDRAA